MGSVAADRAEMAIGHGAIVSAAVDPSRSGPCRLSLRGLDMAGPRRPQCDGVLQPDEPLTSPSDGSAHDFARVPPGRPEPPGAETLCGALVATDLRLQDGGEDPEDQQHRQANHRRQSKRGGHDLVRRCMHADETPSAWILFHRQS
jgi:hypothetical protein